jgi:hypothetical protein
MATNPPGALVLTPLHGDPRSLDEWLTTFHLASVVLDPYTNQSSWILPTAQRVLHAFQGGAARVNFIITCTPEEAQQFLGPLAQEFLVFCDPDRTVVKALGLQSLPAFVFIRLDGTVAASAEGWNPAEWRIVAKEIATTTAWSSPTIPDAGDPSPFEGTPAVG